MIGTGPRRAASSLPLSALYALLVCLLVAAPVTATGAPAGVGEADPEGAPARVAKVVIIVGPTGSLTASFLREAEAAARIARRHSTDVTTIYTPHATWAAVKPALQGADIVIYLGHGNGWPSIYRNSLYRATQNGLGLNPVAGGGDDVHRYYGERFVARDVKLAPGAIVLLHHLCYAAGNSEPGLPEGPHDVAKQRVENYAAGWLAAGADAVVAEAYLGPAYYVRSLFETRRSMERIWRSSPTFKGNVEAWPSNRTAGATALIDPHVVGKRYGRSLVLRDGSTPTVATEPGVPADPPPLTGVRLGQPTLAAPIVTGTAVELSVPLRVRRDVSLPAGMTIGASWQAFTGEAGQPVPGDVAEWLFARSTSSHAVVPLSESEQAAEDDPATVPVQPTELVPVDIARRSLSARLVAPEGPGLYLLHLSLHDADGDLLEAESKARLSPVLVQVAPPLSASYDLPDEMDAEATGSILLPMTLFNDGSIPWQQQESDALDERGPDPFRVIPPEPASVVVHLAKMGPTENDAVISEVPLAAIQVVVPPGKSANLELFLPAPLSAGEYLLIFDVVSPSLGSLGESGITPGLVRLHIGPAPVPSSAAPFL